MIHQPTRIEPSTEYGLIGLAFSGGGIRSATFNLGVYRLWLEKAFSNTSIISRPYRVVGTLVRASVRCSITLRMERTVKIFRFIMSKENPSGRHSGTWEITATIWHPVGCSTNFAFPPLFCAVYWSICSFWFRILFWLLHYLSGVLSCLVMT